MNFYLLYSDDKSLVNKELDNIKNRLSISRNDIIYYDIEDISGVLEEALTMSMFSLNKLIVIDATAYLKKKKNISDIKLLEDYFSNYNKNNYLVFLSYGANIDNNKKLVKLIKDNGEIKKLEISNEYLTSYILNYISSNGYKINMEDITFLLNKSGRNINNITNELDKLMLYKINDKFINRDDISSLIIDSSEDSIYDLVNAILNNNTEKGIRLYNKFILSGMDPSQIMVILSSQIRLLFQVKRLYSYGKKKEDIAKILDIKNIYRVKHLINDSYYYSEGMLLKYLYKLAELDKEIKLGTKDGKVFLELFILGKDLV